MVTAKKTAVKSTPQTSLELTKNQKIILLVTLVVAALLYYGRGFFVAATINGTPITRWSVVQQLEKTSGKQVLEGLVTRELVLQEAKKRNITVSDQEIDQEIKNIETNVTQQGGNFEEILKTQGMTRADLGDQVKLQKLVEKMFADEMKVSEAEIDKFMTDNQDNLPETTDESALRVSVRQQLEQQKLSGKAQALIESLKKSSKINYFVNY